MSTVNQHVKKIKQSKAKNEEPHAMQMQEEKLAVATDESSAYFKRQAVFWAVSFVILSAFLCLFSSVLLPFVLGMTIAYFLDPIADRLEKAGLSRLLATIAILVSFIVIFVAFIMLVAPILVAQFMDFANKMPSYIARLQLLMSPENMKWAHDKLGIDLATLQKNIGSILGQLSNVSTSVLQSLWTSAGTVLNLASLFVVTPVVAFYTLLDWDRMVTKVDDWIPRDHVKTVRVIGSDVNTAIAGFIRGQGLVCLILGCIYALGLIMTGLNFGLLIGMAAGLMSFIPYIGAIVGLAVAMIVAVVQFWPDGFMLSMVGLVFVVGQFIEGNILSPKLVGESIGLHPVWLMFSLFAFGSLFGFVGLMVAVPSAAALGVLVRFVLGRYKASPLYLGHTMIDQ
jgi:predicted PurR-regulated permease PerM